MSYATASQERGRHSLTARKTNSLRRSALRSRTRSRRTVGHLRRHGSAINQELRSRDDYLVTRFHAVEYHVVVFDGLANLQRSLVRYVRTGFRILLRDERKILPSNPG